MNKKVLALTLILLAIPLLTIVPVQAGKGQEKLYFKLYAEGMPDFTTFDRWWQAGVTAHIRGDRWWQAGVTAHIRGMPWLVLGAFEVTIGEDPPIPLDPGDYSSSQDLNSNTKTTNGEMKERIIITFDGGTLEILAVGKLYNALSLTMYIEGTFVGHGTGALEGVKVAGTISSTIALGGLGLGMTYEGTVMGWPTP